MPTLDPNQLLGLAPPSIEEADAVVLPLPMEMTVSYGKGTAGGPRAIVAASSQIELFDEETLVDFSERPKVLTLPPPMLDGSAEGCLDTIRRQAAGLRDRFLLAIGGEHLATYGAVAGLVEDLGRTTIVQIDAHADLADELGGRRWSHGTVMRRLWEQGCRLIQIGIRSLSRPEYELARTGERIATFYAHQLAERWPELLAMLRGLEGTVYLSIDVDGLDPSIIPSTGTPQPNGLTWRQAMDVIRCVAAAPRSRWVGADVMEFVPSPQPPGCDPSAARLVMKVLAHWAASRGWTTARSNS